MLEILFQDSHIVCINKPHDLLVHRSPIAKDATIFAIQELRDQINQKVFPAHRLDRKTSGALLFALTSEMNIQLMKLFADRAIRKEYLAIVRGYAPEKLTIDYPLINESGKSQEAITHIETLDFAELEVPFGKHNTSRYSLVRVNLETGRMHQIRKHLAHISHPIIADRAHGCNKQNKLFKEQWSMTTMLLHAQSLNFVHPETQQELSIHAPLQKEFTRVVDFMGFKKSQFP